VLARLIYVRWIALPCLLLLSVGCSLAACASSSSTGRTEGGGSPSDSTASSSETGHGALNARDFETAKNIALREAERSARSLSSATATRSAGTVTDSNTGHQCTSGSVLHIKLIGTFNIVTGGHPLPSGSANADDLEVHGVLITADPNTAQTCLISVQTGTVEPDPGATVLFTKWP
jgi:hypothetical protein